MDTVKQDKEEPLKTVYASLLDSARISVDRDAYKIQKYFSLWCLFIILSVFCTAGLIYFDFINETVGKRIQRTGSIIPSFALVGEAIYLIKLNKLASIIHPANLTPEIYLSRRFDILKKISLWLTLSFVILGSVLSGYGDLLHKNLSVLSF